MTPARILVVDAFDSFVNIVRHHLVTAGAEPVVVRSNELTPAAAAAIRPDAVLLGSGAGHPLDSGHVEIVRALAGETPILGVGLGHEAVALAYGAPVVPVRQPSHGKVSRIQHDRRGVFAGLPPAFPANRYHWLAVAEDGVPGSLEITARSLDDQQVMGLRHRWLPIESVQFQPESLRTQGGLRMIENFVSSVARVPAAELAA